MTGIACPACAAVDASAVTDSRPGPSGWRRRRQCGCGHRFTTLEIVVPPSGVSSVVSIRCVQGGTSPVVSHVHDAGEDNAAKALLAQRIAAAVDQVLGL